MSRTMAGMVLDEIEYDIQNGVQAEYFYSYDSLLHHPVAAAQVITMDSGVRYIAWLACYPEHMNRGHGSDLIKKILYKYRGNLILTLPTRSTEGFYKKHGFRLIDDRMFGISAEQGS